MRIFTIGYGNQGFDGVLRRLEAALKGTSSTHFLVLDVRRKPRSWCRELTWPAVAKNVQMAGHEYRHCPYLGNNGDAEHVKLCDERLGLAELRTTLEGLTNGAELVLLCAEWKHERCHRSYVAELARELYGVEVVHL